MEDITAQMVMNKVKINTMVFELIKMATIGNA